MIKRILVAAIIGMLAIGFNVVPAEAYTSLKPAVSISADGLIVGQTVSFSVVVVDQGTVDPPSGPISFGAQTGIADSGKALKIRGGTNEVNSRIVIYTDNNSYFTPGHDPNVDTDGNATGVDGSGMVGNVEAAYVVPLFWGVKSAADYDPNISENYIFDGNLNDGIGEVYIVDKRHTHSFIPDVLPQYLIDLGWTKTMLDNNELYKADGTLVQNRDGDDLYPQRWAEDLYDAAVAPRNKISEALYKNIATLAFGIVRDPSSADYLCNVPKLTTTSTADNVLASLAAPSPDPAYKSLFIYIGADFRGKPAQSYYTTKLTLEMVQN